MLTIDTVSAETKALLNELRLIARTKNEEFLTLPPTAYFSSELFELEKEIIFKQGWILIAREDQVANSGDYLALRVCDENIVLTRDKYGGLHVLSNVCTHRWMPAELGQAGNGSLSRLAKRY